MVLGPPALAHDVVPTVRAQTDYRVPAPKQRHCYALHSMTNTTRSITLKFLAPILVPAPQQGGTDRRLEHRNRSTPEFLLSQYIPSLLNR